MSRPLARSYPVIALLLSVLSYASQGQLKADFSFDKSGGCSPLIISFTNLTTGASPNVLYEWQFDNGNVSSLKNPSAIFEQERSFTITLTARDGNQSSVKTQNITVYKKPSIEFTSSVEKGCVPLQANFTAKAQAGDGSVANYFWDFGDGVAQQVTGSQVNHSYTEVMVPSVSVTVTNSFGCQTSLVKERLITVLPSTIAKFNADERTLCLITDAATFKNNSTGPGSLSYQWDFGDGSQSTAKEPAHTFTAIGTYAIKLKVTSSEGCVDSSIQASYINAANFKSDVEWTNPVCSGTFIELKNTSQPVPLTSTWEFSDGFVNTYPGSGSAHRYFYTAGMQTIKLTNQFGACKDVVTKKIEVKESPSLKGFVVDITQPCGAPVLVKYKDTTATAVKWQWSSSWPSDFQSSLKEPSHTYTTDYWYGTNLTVTDANGCSATAYKEVVVRKPYITITSPDVALSGQVKACGLVPVRFVANTTEIITDYKWDFGDGGTSTSPQPVYTYPKAGDYRVRLNYTLANGCTGSVMFSEYVVVRDKVEADFTASATEVCGNTTVTFSNKSGNTVYYYWDFGQGYIAANTGQYQNIMHQFYEEGSYTIKLIATDWVCADTMIKKDYINVKAPFPKIARFTNTCDGERNTVTFNQTSRQTDSWHWDFGDGTTLLLNSDQPQVQHTYAKTGSYKVVLRNTNGNCTVGDSVLVTVLLRQKPVLSIDKAVVCLREDYLKISISNLEKNPSASSYYYGYGFRLNHDDGTPAISDGIYADLTNMPLTTTKWNFIPGKSGLQAIVFSEHFGCADTSNAVPLVLKGPSAGFKVRTDNPCNNGHVVYLVDASTTMDGVPIVSWEWNFGDGTSQQVTKVGEVFHDYRIASIFYASLKVTDASGCTSISQAWVDTRMNVLKATFTTSATTISPGTIINFYNSTTGYDPANTSFKWLFGDGSESLSYHATKTYTAPGTYTVLMIAANPLKGCSDTARTTIIVKYVNAAFTINKSNISNSSCPPVLVRFSNTSSNVSKIKWDFGDGTVVTNQFSPSHVYLKPGFYKVILETVSDNGTKYITEDSVIIKQPAATLLADVFHGCTAQTINFTASAQNTMTYFWDFGDGNIQMATDSTSQHRYPSAGVYTPRLIVRDAGGCASSVAMNEKIVIDSLFLALQNIPATICSPKEISFDPLVVSVAANQAGQTLDYHWDFGTGNATDTADTKLARFRYEQPGSYTINLTVRSPYGCMKQTTASITAYQGLGGRITGAAETCVEAPVQLTASTILPGQAQWKWLFDDGTSSLQQTPPPLSYRNAGNHTITLLVDNNSCVDTVVHKLTVHPKPTVTASASKTIVCEGSAVQLTASGGSSYQWSPGIGLSNTTGAATAASPLINTNYKVAVTNSFGCVNVDSVRLQVIKPFLLQLPANASVCEGSAVQLRAAGAETYKWIDNVQGLNNTSIAAPLARPSANTSYTVVATDAYQCFTDTASIAVTVMPLPSVNAGPDLELLTGAPLLFQPTFSSDVISWSWFPGDYLSCTNCPAPEVKPLSPTKYIVSVRNGFGCTATDTVSLNLICSESRVSIPNIFTPDLDGRNDGFGIKGQGIRTVHYLRIYNRWGQQVFERKNFMINDKNAFWDGRYKGALVPTGHYVYVVEMSCNEKTFSRKGTVMVTY